MPTVSTEEQSSGIRCLDDLDNGGKTKDLGRDIGSGQSLNTFQYSSVLGGLTALQ